MKKIVNFIDYFNDFLKDQTKLVGFGLAPNTLKTYNNRTNNFKDFLTAIRQPAIQSTGVTIALLRKFDIYLRTEKHHSNDYVMKNVQFVGRMLNHAIENGEISFNPIKHYRFKYERRRRMIFLDLQQLINIKKCKLPTKDLEINRDIFLFGCYTGLSYCDIKNFQDKNIVVGEDGTDWIKIVRQKTRIHNDTMLPMLSGALEILEKYEYKLPIPANSNMNLNLKKISKLAGIEIPLCTHAGRKTFGNVLINDFGVDLKTVSIMMGHTSVKTTESWYVDIRPVKIIRDMAPVRMVKW